MIQSIQKIMLLFSGAICSFLANSQNHFLEVNAGYAFSAASQTIGIRTVYSPNDSVQKELKGTLGQGHSFALRYGYQTKGNFFLECAVNRFVGFRYDYQTQLNPIDPSTTDTTTIIYMIEGKALRITPSLGFQFNKNKNSFYIKTGMIFALPSIRFRERAAYGDGTKSFIETKYSDGLAYGASIESGMEHHFNKQLSFMVNLQLISMSYAPKKGVIVNYLQNGVDYTDALSTYERIVEYQKETSNQSAFDSNAPRQEIREFHPFSSIGFHLGIRYRIGAERSAKRSI